MDSWCCYATCYSPNINIFDIFHIPEMLSWISLPPKNPTSQECLSMMILKATPFSSTSLSDHFHIRCGGARRPTTSLRLWVSHLHHCFILSMTNAVGRPRVIVMAMLTLRYSLLNRRPGNNFTVVVIVNFNNHARADFAHNHALSHNQAAVDLDLPRSGWLSLPQHDLSLRQRKLMFYLKTPNSTRL